MLQSGLSVTFGVLQSGLSVTFVGSSFGVLQSGLSVTFVGSSFGVLQSGLSVTFVGSSFGAQNSVLSLSQSLSKGRQHTVGARSLPVTSYEGWNFNSGNYLFTTDTK